MKTRYIYPNMEILSVTDKSRVVSARKDPADPSQVITVRERVGWIALIENGGMFNFGLDEPPVSKGMKVTVILEVEHDA